MRTYSPEQRAANNARSKRHYEANRSRRLSSAKRWREEHPDKRAAYASNQYHKTKESPVLTPIRGQIESIFCDYRNGASRRGLVFDLCTDEFQRLILSDCFYCGAEPSNFLKVYKVPMLYNGVDRIDNGIGYVSRNVVSCCKFCNRAKMNSAYAEWMSYLDNLVGFRTRMKNEQRQ